jgi:hypothetical protein
VALCYSQFSHMWNLYLFFSGLAMRVRLQSVSKVLLFPLFLPGHFAKCKNVSYGIVFPARTHWLIISLSEVRTARAQLCAFLFFINYCLRCPKILQYMKEKRVLELYQLLDTLQKSLKIQETCSGHWQWVSRLSRHAGKHVGRLLMDDLASHPDY